MSGSPHSVLSTLPVAPGSPCRHPRAGRPAWALLSRGTSFTREDAVPPAQPGASHPASRTPLLLSIGATQGPRACHHVQMHYHACDCIRTPRGPAWAMCKGAGECVGGGTGRPEALQRRTEVTAKLMDIPAEGQRSGSSMPPHFPFSAAMTVQTTARTGGVGGRHCPHSDPSSGSVREPRAVACLHTLTPHTTARLAARHSPASSCK